MTRSRFYLGRRFGKPLLEHSPKWRAQLEIAERALMVYVELGPLRAIGWAERTYPFPPDTTAAGGLEPLLCPWAGGSRK